ncbi:hypothetical protein [Bifidobacterium callitrichos]|uniref:hypothetical protein n=1 Tax=Bifidobacterium callitrichos TaxID=762209 RepID=UPI0005B7CCEE|nr:hypothetical protein [Bifidobacterium callitrichos]
MNDNHKPNDEFDDIDLTGMLTGPERDAMNDEDAKALALIAARMGGNALMLMHNALADHNRQVVFVMPTGMSEHARSCIATALDIAAGAFAEIEDRNTDDTHTFDTAVRRFGLMQEENTR